MKKLLCLLLAFVMTTTVAVIVSAASDSTNAKSAELISLNESITGVTPKMSDEGTFYKFKLTEQGSVTIKVTAEDGAGPSLRLYSFDGDNFEKITSNNIKDGNPFYTDTFRLIPDTYYIQIKNYDYAYSHGKKYSLIVNFKPESGDNFECENNDSYNNANEIKFNTSVVGNIETSDDEDYYVFKSTQQQHVKIRFSLDFVNESDRSWKITLYEVKSSNLEEIDSIFASENIIKNLLTGGCYVETESILLSLGGRYCIQVKCSNGWYHSNKDYNLEIISENSDSDNTIGESNDGTTTTSFGSDVSNWAKKEVEDAYEEGLIPETLVGTDLTQKINRSEFAAVAVLIYENLTRKNVYASSEPFNDINSDPNKKAINKAYKLGITVGTSSTTFDPSRNITREELATMLCRGVKKYKFPDWTPDTDYMYYIQGTSGIKFADDAEISDYAKNSVYFMSSAGIIKGIDSTHFAPKASVTRGDALDYGMATREQAIIMAKRIKENKSYFDEI